MKEALTKDPILDDENIDGVNLRQRAQQASNVKQSVRISAKQLTRFFDGSLWNNDFSDSSEGFYGIYRTLFETISQSEMYAMAPAGEAPLSPSVQYPSFGNSGTTYDAPNSELKQFYSAFLSFASRRPFNEADKYRLQDAPDRQVRRLMERENKKARDDARREYNEAVRSLAAFLKKRDPRFMNSASSDPVKLKQLEKKRLEAQLREAALQAAKQREKAAKAYVEQDWMKVKSNVAVEDEWDESDGLEEGEAHNGVAESPQEEGFEGEDEEPVDDWYCAACDKIFGSQGAWDNHERSRKHLQNTKRLKKEMLAEDESMATSQELSTPQEAVEPENGELDIDDLEKEFRKLSKKERKRFGLHKLQAFEEHDVDLASAASSDPKESEEALAASTTAQDTESLEPEAEARAVIPEKANDESAIPQISKRDKRRGREAAKKAAQLESPAEEVRSLLLRSWSLPAELVYRSVASVQRSSRHARSSSHT